MNTELRDLHPGRVNRALPSTEFVAVLLAIVVLSLAGCSADTGEGPANEPPGGGIALSEATGSDFQSIEELTEAAELIVVAEAAGVESRGTIGEVDFVTTKLSVVNAIKGSIDAASISLRQVDTAYETAHLPPAVEAGTTYLLFLIAFEFEPGAPTGDYTLVGSSGQFAWAGDAFEGQLGGHSHGVEVTRVEVDEDTGTIAVAS